MRKYKIKDKEKLTEELLRKFKFISTKEDKRECLIFDNRLKNLWDTWKDKEKIFIIKKEKIRDRWYGKLNCENNLTLKEFKEVLSVLENYIEEENESI